MKIDLLDLTVRELRDGDKDSAEDGVKAYGGLLDVRPPYQREFVYKDHQRAEVIRTVQRGFPLNVMYWAVNQDGTFEVIDGQQRTISICQYVTGQFALDDLYFHNLKSDAQDQILDYKLTIYLCSGSDTEKLKWFETINIAGEELTHQELRNAVYSGPWVTDAKRFFSKTGCAAAAIGSDYVNGSPIRQEYLETAISWIAPNSINSYMAEKQFNPSANELWLHFQKVIEWVKVTFPNYRREMKGLPWGHLYREYQAENLDPKELEELISVLMEDEDVTAKKGIYWYVLSEDEKHLNIRQFTNNQKREAFERQAGKCPLCTKTFEINQMEGDHITPWVEGGKTSSENCQMLCIECNRRKGSK
jgi:hypothetical protein